MTDDPRHTLERLIRSRSRSWRDDWVRRTCEGNESQLWPLVRRLIRDGEAAKPEGDAYAVMAINGFQVADFERSEPVRGLADVLRLDPEFLAQDLWSLFEVEEVGVWLAQEGVHRENRRWTTALAELAADGTVDRGRLLDASLAGLRRDFTPHAARWLQRLHELLAPAPEERAARQADYLALLSSGDPALVGFALRTLAVLEKARLLDAVALVERIGPAMLVPAKSHATRAAKLAARTLRRDPSLAGPAMPAFADALLHEAREVQDVAVEALERHRDAIGAATAERLAELADSVDPALRPRVRALAGGGAVMVVTTAPPAPARPFDRLADPRLPYAAPIEPIGSVGEVLDRVAVLLERPDDPAEIELVLAAIVRHCAARVDPGRAAALVSRVRAAEDSMSVFDARLAVGFVLVAWLDPGSGRGLSAPAGSPLLAVVHRVRALAAAVRQRRADALLAAPTHTGGWVEPREAVRRIAALRGTRPGASELAQLVLRLAPDGRACALVAAGAVNTEAGGILRRALGGDDRRRRITRLGIAWDAAEQGRDPERALAAELLPLDETVGGTGDVRLRGRRRLQAASPADHLAVAPADAEFGGSPAMMRWLSLTSPINRERLYALGVAQLSAEWPIGGTDEVLSPLLEPGEPFGPAALRLVALAIGAEPAVVRAAATDVLIATFGDRRLDGERVGGELAEVLLRRPTAVPTRWADPLADVAGAGHPHDVHRVAERILGVARDTDRRKVLGLVDLLRRLAIEHGLPVSDPATRAFLETLPPGSKGGGLAREALAVGDRP